MLKTSPRKRASRAAAKRAPVDKRGRKPALGRDAWLTAAREALLREGIAGVEIGRLARRLKVTRGGFYWFFDSRKQLLDEMLTDWETTNTLAFESALRHSGRNGIAEFTALVEMWVNEEAYSPTWDSAVRDWARIAPKVANVVRRVDDARIAILKQIFLDMGCTDEAAFVRARITYFHQIGYYALGVRESREQRRRLLPLYIAFLTGAPLATSASPDP